MDFSWELVVSGAEFETDDLPSMSLTRQREPSWHSTPPVPINSSTVVAKHELQRPQQQQIANRTSAAPTAAVQTIAYNGMALQPLQ